MRRPRTSWAGVPSLSVVVAPDGFATNRRAVGCLARQTARHPIERVVVAPSPATHVDDEERLAAFPRVVRVARGPAGSIGQANAAGVPSGGRIVALAAETTPFPIPGGRRP